MATFRRQGALLGFVVGAALVTLVGCGSDDNGAGGDDGDPGGNGGSSGSSGASGSGNSGGGGQASGRILWTTSSFIPSLRGLDTGTHELVFDVDIVDLDESDVAVNAMEISDDQVWVARDDGVLTAVDRDAQEIAAEIDLTPFGESEPIDLYRIALGGGYAFTSPESNIQPPILGIDTSTFEVALRADILDGVGYPTDIVYDGTDLWILQWNAFELVRADPATLEVRARVALGQDPQNPDTFGEFYGIGYLADTGDTLWIIDAESIRLLRVDKATLTPSAVADLSDLTDLETYVEFEGNSRGAFLLLREPGIVVRFDPQTGARLDTYDFSSDGTLGQMALGSDRLYVIPGGSAFVYDTHEIDIETGNVLQTITSDVAISTIAVQK